MTTTSAASAPVDGPRIRPGRTNRRVVAGFAALVAAALPLLVCAPVGAQSDPVDLVSVHFELTTEAPAAAGPLSAAPATAPIRYDSVQIEHRGVARRLRPVGGSVTVTRSVGEATAVVAEADGLRIGPSAEGYGAALPGFATSPSLGHFVRIDAAGAEGGVVLDLDLGRPLGPDDYLLVQEAGGDAAIRIESLAGPGGPTGAVTDIGAPYAWNTGHRIEPGQELWATVVPVPLPADGSTASGLRIRTASAELKVLVLGPALAGATAATPAAVEAGPTSAAATPAAVEAGPTSAAAAAAPVEVATPPTVASSETPTTAPAPAPEEVEVDAETDSGAAADDSTPSVPVPPSDSAPAPVEPLVEAVTAPTPARSAASPATALAMTGMPTEPWVLVGLATGMIFFGYTTVAAFRRPSSHRAKEGRVNGHAQLDALGFD
jgi:hypothetical protein